MYAEGPAALLPLTIRILFLVVGLGGVRREF